MRVGSLGGSRSPLLELGILRRCHTVIKFGTQISGTTTATTILSLSVASASMIVVVAGGSGSIALTLHKELIALCIFHGGLVLNGFLVLLVVKSHTGWIKIEEVSDFVGHISSNFFFSAIFQPDLKKSLLSP